MTVSGDGTVYYSDFGTQRVMRLPRRSGDGEGKGKEGKDEECADPVPITPDGGRYRFADGEHDLGRDRLIMVREDHGEDGEASPADVSNVVCSVPCDGSGTDGSNLRVLAEGGDFYSSPRLSPDGSRVAYVTWDHPSMPWDATELRVATLESDGATSSSSSASHDLVAGEDGDTSVLQPLWHPMTGDLFYISDESGYYNIYRSEGGKGKGVGGSEAVCVLPMPYDFGGSSPGWTFGQRGYTFLRDGRIAATYSRGGKSVLLVADVSGPGEARDVVEYGQEDGLPVMFGGLLQDTKKGDSDDGDGIKIYFMGGGPGGPGGVYEWTMGPDPSPARMLASSSTLQVPPGCISAPRQISFPCPLGESHGYYYAPSNDAYRCESEAAPPLLVKAHGGPTAAASAAFNPAIQYWTSRGFAVLDVDYGGSTGYGREYRRRLRGMWGVVDVDDVCAGAEHLVKEGLADPARLAIDGGSAGGYTTLGALAFRDVFTAGCSLYGVASLEALAGDTHKFESRYLDGLVGPYPEEKALYKSRAPIESVDTLSCPILLLQGDEDKIVPPNQAELMHRALLEKGIPTALKMYEGEQHGFRKAENIEDALDSELYFYSRVFNFTAPGVPSFRIDNLPQ